MGLFIHCIHWALVSIEYRENALVNLRAEIWSSIRSKSNNTSTSLPRGNRWRQLQHRQSFYLWSFSKRVFDIESVKSGASSQMPCMIKGPSVKTLYIPATWGVEPNRSTQVKVNVTVTSTSGSYGNIHQLWRETLLFTIIVSLLWLYTTESVCSTICGTLHPVHRVVGYTIIKVNGFIHVHIQSASSLEVN